MPNRRRARRESYISDDSDDSSKKPQQKKCWSLWFLLPCCFCIALLLLLALVIPAAFYVQNEFFDCMKDPPETEGLLRMWDNSSRFSGYAVSYRCFGLNSPEVVQIVTCSYGNWSVVMEKSHYCEEMRTRRDCSEEPPQAAPEHPWDWNTWSRRVGKKIRYMCNTAADSQVMMTVVCNDDLLWVVESNTPANCLCGSPMMYSLPLLSDWDNKSVELGTTIVYECQTVLGRKHFQTLVCATNSKWRVIDSGICFFFIPHLLNFTNAAEYCRQLGTEMSLIENDGEQAQVKALLAADEEYETTCKSKVFLGFRENVNKQWETDDGLFLSGASELWSVNDEGREKCVVMVGPDFHFNNVLCQMQYCYVCEVIGTPTTSSLCPEKATCYVLGSEKGDYRFSNNRCQGIQGQLARVVNMNVMDKIRKMIWGNPQVENCKGFYVGLRNVKRYYERLNGQQITYQRFADDTARSMTRHCAVVDQFFRYDWMDETCSLNTCFMCKAIGFPIRTIVHSGLKMQLTDDMRDIIAQEETNMRRRRQVEKVLYRIPPSCAYGWASFGNYCLAFNTTNVRHDVSASWCREKGGISFTNNEDYPLHQIVQAVRMFGSADKRPFWHLVSWTRGDNSYCNNDTYHQLDVTTGRLNGSNKNCANKLPFICFRKHP